MYFDWYIEQYIEQMRKYKFNESETLKTEFLDFQGVHLHDCEKIFQPNGRPYRFAP